MATNTYKCTVCKRVAERIENARGLDILGKCIITDGCRGKLRKVGRNLDNIRESFPKFEVNLEDYVARDAFASYKQDIASNTWVVTHDLNCEPAVTVFIADESGKYTELAMDQYEVKTVNRSSSRLLFAKPVSGVAHFLPRSTAKDTSKPVETTGLTQVTVNGSFVFAFPKLLTKFDFPPTVNPIPGLPMDLKNPVGDIMLEVILERPNEEEIVCFEKLSGMFDLTPWSGIDEIMVAKRKNYYLKTKNILNFTTFNNPDLTFDQIPEGTRLRFIRVDFGIGVKQPIQSKSVLMLLSAAPYEFTDRIRNKIIDLGELFSAGQYLTYSNGEFYIDNRSVEKTYPPIDAARKPGPVPPLPSPTPTPTITPTITVTATNTPTPTVTRTATPTPSVTLTPGLSQTASPTPTPTPTPTSAPIEIFGMLNDAIYGTTYNDALSAAGGAGGYHSWAVVDGELPPGLSMDPDTGEITGTPTL